MSEAQHKALFLDRDGVINVDTGYVHLSEHICFIEGIFDVCRAAKTKNYLIIIVTNQSGIGRGYYSEGDFHRLMEWMKSQFTLQGISIDAVYFCPHHPQEGKGEYRRDCPDRKPNPGMLIKAQREYNIDLERSILIGDRDSDHQAGKKAGIGRIFQLGQTISSLGEVVDLL